MSNISPLNRTSEFSIGNMKILDSAMTAAGLDQRGFTLKGDSARKVPASAGWTPWMVADTQVALTPGNVSGPYAEYDNATTGESRIVHMGSGQVMPQFAIPTGELKDSAIGLVHEFGQAKGKHQRLSVSYKIGNPSAAGLPVRLTVSNSAGDILGTSAVTATCTNQLP